MKLSAVDFLEVDEVEHLHDLVLAASGGAAGVRDCGLLESALAAPRTTAFGQLAYGTLASMAGALAFRLAKNHAFIDGNKRTAAVVAAAFLRMNGFRVDFEDPAWVDRFEHLADGRLTMHGLAELFAQAMGGDVDIDIDD